MEYAAEQSAERQNRLALIELVERDGHVARSVGVYRWPLTVGRALDNDLVLDDPHVAPHHVWLQPGVDGAVVMTVGDTVNGVGIGKLRHVAGAQVPLPASGASLQIGAVKLRLRLPAETLPPERALPALARAGLAASLMAGAVWLAIGVAEHWISLDPGADTAAWLPFAVGVPATLAAWCGVWALASKLFQHRFDFAGHLRIVLPWLLAIGLIDAAVPPLAASLGWPWLWRLSGPFQGMLALLMLRAHFRHVLPMSGRTITVVLASAALAGAAVALTLTQRTTDRFSRPPYMSVLPLPALNAARAVPSQALVLELAPLAARLAERVKRARAEEAADEEAAVE